MAIQHETMTSAAGILCYSSSRRFVLRLVMIGAPTLGFAPLAYSQRNAPDVPQVSFELAVGAVSSHIGLQPALHTALGMRIGPARSLAPIVGLELGAFGSGYGRNVGHVRSDGTSFDAPYLVGAYMASLGLRARPISTLLLTTSIGAGRLAPWRSAAQFIDADVAVSIGASAAITLAARSLTARDPDAQKKRRFESVTVGVRFLSDP